MRKKVTLMNKMEDLIEWLKGVAKEHNITVLTESQWPSDWVCLLYTSDAADDV